MESGKKAVFLAIVTGRKNKEDVLAALNELKVNFVDVIYGKGAVSATILQDIFGLAPEENKVVIVCITSKEKSDSVCAMLIDRFRFDMPNTGMAFTVPVDAVSY